MWMMTPIGFYSAVQHRQKRAHVIVRARARADLERLVALPALQPERLKARVGAIETTLGADYPHRVVMHKRAWQAAAAALADVDYDNFKSAVANRQSGKRASVYHRVWSALVDIEREDPDAQGRGGPWGRLKAPLTAGEDRAPCLQCGELTEVTYELCEDCEAEAMRDGAGCVDELAPPFPMFEAHAR